MALAPSKLYTPEGKHEVGDTIRRFREYELKWTQSELADELGCYQGRISIWENGEYVPDIPYFLRIMTLMEEAGGHEYAQALRTIAES